MSSIVIVLELTDEASDFQTRELADAVLNDIKYYDPEESGGDLRELVKSYGYEIIKSVKCQ